MLKTKINNNNKFELKWNIQNITSNIFGIISYWTIRINCPTSNVGSIRQISVNASLVSDWLNIDAFK